MKIQDKAANWKDMEVDFFYPVKETMIIRLTAGGAYQFQIEEAEDETERKFLGELFYVQAGTIKLFLTELEPVDLNDHSEIR